MTVRRLGVSCAIAAALVVGPSAHADHGPSMSRTLTPTSGGGFEFGEASGGPRLLSSLAYDSAYYGRTMGGADELGSVWRNSLSLSTQFSITNATRIGATAGAGVVSLSPEQGASDSEAGLSDTELYLSQRLFPLPGRIPGSHTPTLRLRVSAIVPTGDSGGSALSSMSGEVAHHSVASLGSGTWAMSAMVPLRWAPTDRLSTFAQVGALVPVRATEGSIRWAPTLSATVGGRTSSPSDAVGGSLALGYEQHLASHTDGPGPAMETIDIGGRRTLRGEISVDVRISRRLRCSLLGRLPLWQDVDGIQLVESFSTSARCAVAFDL